MQLSRFVSVCRSGNAGTKKAVSKHDWQRTCIGHVELEVHRDAENNCEEDHSNWDEVVGSQESSSDPQCEGHPRSASETATLDLRWFQSSGMCCDSFRPHLTGHLEEAGPILYVD